MNLLFIGKIIWNGIIFQIWKFLFLWFLNILLFVVVDITTCGYILLYHVTWLINMFPIKKIKECSGSFVRLQVLAEIDSIAGKNKIPAIFSH